ncbi:MAG: ATP-binding protein [Mogibacterium sp.]|nr:ATP-binding protein [Mogibacterium sp.]
MTDYRFLFYRDNTGTGDWHDTLAALGAGKKIADDTPQGRRTMLDPYGKARTVTDTGSKTRAAAPARENTEIAESIRQLTCRLVEFATEFALYGNVWQQWITYNLMMHENPFTLACERKTVSRTATMIKLAQQDFAQIREMFRMDFTALGKENGIDLLAAMTDYKVPYAQETGSEGRQIRMLTDKLARARDEETFGRTIAEYYAEYGNGIYGLYRAFRIAEGEDEFRIVPVKNTEDVKFSDLIGYEEQKKTLRDNTEAFVKGAHANNVLLYGDSGTGKSTSVHALMHDYYSKGLRLVEVSKADRSKLPQVLSEIKQRNYRFIIFLDDLSFEENESDYKELKAMLEGALETRSDRVLIYATSNRRHLIRETWKDRSDMEYDQDIHRSDTMEEKLSLASRFGVTIYYAKPVPAEYLNIVRTLAERHKIDIAEQDLEDIARKWELRHGGMSGRTASQLITWLRGEASRKGK